MPVCLSYYSFHQLGQVGKCEAVATSAVKAWENGVKEIACIGGMVYRRLPVLGEWCKGDCLYWENGAMENACIGRMV